MSFKKQKKNILLSINNFLNKKFQTNSIFLLFSLAIIIFLIFNIGKGIHDNIQIQNLKKQTEEEVKKLYLEKQKLLLKKQLSDKDFVIEYEAKKALGLIKQDEKVLIFKEE